MRKSVFKVRSALPVPALLNYHWHNMPGAFPRLSPPWQDLKVLLSPDTIADGTQAAFELRLGPLKQQWVAEHFDVKEGRGFSDRQLVGPFAEWTHHHRFLRETESRSWMEDEVHYRVPGGFPGRLLAGGYVRRQLENLFWYRHEVIRGDATRFWKRRTSREGVILVTGHRGMIGSALSAHLRTLGYSVRGLTRSPSGEDEFGWDPMKGTLDPAALEGLTAVVHLAGAGIADHRWTPSYKETLMESRRQGTRLLAEKLAALSEPPPVLVSVSGANFYPLDGKPHGEGGPHGEGFLAKVCEAWEGAADPAREAGLRVVHPRLGVVLSPRGGALAKMLPAFRGGVGGPIGSGRQMFSWIGLHDAVDILVRAIEDERYEGPVNAVAPEALPQREFARTLGRVLRRPSFAPLPAPFVRTLFGREMADETLLADLNLVPNKLREWGYGWRHGDLEAALRYYLGRPTKEARTALLAD